MSDRRSPGALSVRLWQGLLVCALLPIGSAAAQPQAVSSLTLKDAYERALAISEKVALAQTAIAEQTILNRGRDWAIAPTASVVGVGTVQNERDTRLPAPATGVTVDQAPLLAEVTAVVQQPLFRRGYFTALEHSTLALDQAVEQRERVLQTLMMDVTTAFVEVLRSRQAVLLVDAAVQRAEAQSASATARVLAGGALRTTQLQAAISFRDAQVQRVRLTRDLKLQQLKFQQLIGIPPPPTLVLPHLPALPDAEHAVALAHDRSDLHALHKRKAGAVAAVTEAEGLLWPQLDLRLNYDHGASKLAQSPFVFGASVVLTVPLFQGGSEYFKIQRTSLLARAVDLEVTQLEKQITEELGAAFTALDAAQSAFELAEQQIKDAQENYALVSNQFKLRTVTFLEVANAQSALTDAENLRLVSTFDRELAAYRLLYAIGTLHL